jgi:hypothetical protein
MPQNETKYSLGCTHFHEIDEKEYGLHSSSNSKKILQN